MIHYVTRTDDWCFSLLQDLLHVLSYGKGGFAVTIDTKDLNHGAINYFRLSVWVQYNCKNVQKQRILPTVILRTCDYRRPVKGCSVGRGRQ